MNKGSNDNSTNSDKGGKGGLRAKLKAQLLRARGSSSQFYKTKIKPHLNLEALALSVQNFDLQKSIDWISKKANDRGVTFLGTALTIVICSYFLSELGALVLVEYLPSAPPIQSRSNRQSLAEKTINDFNPIFTRNLFNSKGIIPGEEDSGDHPDSSSTPVRTSLPFNLIGTLVMSNETHSLATIEDKSVSIIYPVGIDDEIPGKAKIQKIEPKKVIFLNKTNGRREFVDLPEDSDGGRHVITTAPTGTSIERLSPTQFNVSRSEVDKALADFNKVLTDARAVPNSENGLPNGYKLFQIVPGSIYDKLGLQNGDVITGLNGQTINDPGKAFEMLNELKSTNHLELQVKKDGKPLNYVYDIHN